MTENIINNRRNLDKLKYVKLNSILQNNGSNKKFWVKLEKTLRWRWPFTRMASSWWNWLRRVLAAWQHIWRSITGHKTLANTLMEGFVSSDKCLGGGTDGERVKKLLTETYCEQIWQTDLRETKEQSKWQGEGTAASPSLSLLTTDRFLAP